MPTLPELARLIRVWSLRSTTTAGSGHPSSALSAADLMAGLFFGGHFRFRLAQPNFANNDRLIFSKGHAAPLLYSLWAAAGGIPAEELLTLRQSNSRLEGHPTMSFPFAEVATGSLGQGLAVGVGLALNARRLDKLPYRTFVLLGDSELAEGSNWESIQLASYYQLGNLVGILDVNRLGQRGETMLGHDTVSYEQRLRAFGWNTAVIDGHSTEQIESAYLRAEEPSNRPLMIIAKTLKGKGVKLLENQPKWHGKALSPEQLATALEELGAVDESWRGHLAEPDDISPPQAIRDKLVPLKIDSSAKLSPREAYGQALVRLGSATPEVVVLDAEVSNSTFAEKFAETFPDRFIESFIAEQNMVGMAVGLANRGKIPFVSTFGAFFSRAFDQLRMAGYSLANIKLCGSHVGVSIGQDGVSQMGLEDIALFRSVFACAVLYPSDAVSMQKLVEAAANHPGMVYLRSTRMALPVLYPADQVFRIGGSQTLRHSDRDQITIVGAGITVHEALKSASTLEERAIKVRVIDLYSVEPIDTETLRQAAVETKKLIVVEDHYPEGGIGEAVRSALGDLPVTFRHLAVRHLPHSGTPEENLASAGIDSAAIIRTALKLLQ